MPFEAALVVALSIISASIVALLVVTASRRRAADEEELRQAASSRGWQFESTHGRGNRIRRWRGTTDGVAWTIESVRRVSGKSQANTRRHITRWQTQTGLGAAAPILIVGMSPGKQMPSFDMAKGDGWIAQMAQKAAGFALDKSVDLFFGEEIGRAVDASGFQRVETEAMPGYVVMAADKSEAARLLFQGLKAALTEIGGGPDEERPSVLIFNQGIALARLQQMESANDLEALIQNGLRLTRASTFGRSSPS